MSANDDPAGTGEQLRIYAQENIGAVLAAGMPDTGAADYKREISDKLRQQSVALDIPELLQRRQGRDLGADRAVAAEVTATDPEVLQPNATIFLQTILGQKYTSFEEVTQPQAKAFAKIACQLYEPILLARHGQLEVVQRRSKVLCCYIDGMTDEQIAPLLPAAVQTKALYHDRRTIYETLHRNGYPPEKLQQIFNDYLQGAELNLDPVRYIRPTESTDLPAFEQQKEGIWSVRHAGVAAAEEDNWQNTIFGLCAEYWDDAQLKSLLALLDNRQSDEVQPVRAVIGDLMSKFARFQPGTTNELAGLTRVEWITLNYLSGFRLRDSEKTLSFEQVRAHMGSRYEDEDTSLEEVFHTGLQKLLECAKSEPTNNLDLDQAAVLGRRAIAGPLLLDTLPLAVVIEAPSDAAESTAITTEILTEILQGWMIKPSQLQLLAGHLEGQQIDTASEDYQIAARMLRTVMVETFNRVGERVSNGSARSAFEKRDSELLRMIIGDSMTSRPPRSLQSIVDERRGRNPQQIYVLQDLQASVTASLQRLAKSK